jgi:hypothetical protein
MEQRIVGMVGKKLNERNTVWNRLFSIPFIIPSFPYSNKLGVQRSGC